MKYFDFTCPTPAENLACDEALLERAEEGLEGEILRFWEAKEIFVVVGYANHIVREVNLEACCSAGIPVLRRFTGGGTVLQGPGCLNYSLIVKISDSATANSRQNPFHNIATTNQFILQRHQSAIGSLLKRPVRIAGQTDLALGNRKFSGNAQRRHRRFLIFHGTFLLNFNLSLIEKFLRMPSKQPDYREDRSHTDFLTTLHVQGADVKAVLQQIWNANEPLKNIPQQRIRTLADERYSTDVWNLKL